MSEELWRWWEEDHAPNLLDLPIDDATTCLGTLTILLVYTANFAVVWWVARKIFGLG